MSYLIPDFPKLFGMACALSAIFYYLFRRSIRSITDPLGFGCVLVAFYLSGALFIPEIFPINTSYVFVIVLVVLYVLVGAASSRSHVPGRPLRLAVAAEPQYIFTAVLVGMILANLILNQFFGVMPLFTGTQTRAAYGSVIAPTLLLLSPDLSLIVLIIFLLTEIRSVRRLGGIGVLLSVASTILVGSKTSVFGVVFTLCVSDYVLNVKAAYPLSESERVIDAGRIKNIRKWGGILGTCSILVLPAYLAFIGAGGSGGLDTALELMATRLFGGFDGLAIITARDIDITSVQGVSLSGFYLYPILKKFASAPEFQSAGTYLMYLLTGSYNAAIGGLNPNSSFPIELLITNGSIWKSAGVVVIAASAVFRARSALIRRGDLRMLDVVLWSVVVFGPFSILTDGAYFVIRLYEMLGLYMILNLGINLLAWLSPGRKVFRLL